MINDEEVDRYLNIKGMQNIQEFLEIESETQIQDYNLSNLIELICILVKKKNLDYQSLFDITEKDTITNKQRMLLQQLIKNSVIDLDEEYGFVKDILIQLDPEQAIEIFKDIAQASDDAMSIQDLFDVLYEKIDQNFSEKILTSFVDIAAIEPHIFKDYFEEILMLLSQNGAQSEVINYKYLQLIMNIMQINNLKISKEQIEMLLKQSHHLIILTLQQSTTQKDLLQEDRIEFLISLIQRLDKSQRFTNQVCLQPLIQIVQSVIIDQDDIIRQSGILMLQLLARYLDSKQIQEIYPLILMVIQISRFYSTKNAIVSTTLQVLRGIIKISDAHLFEIYGNDVLCFLKEQFISNQDQDGKIQAYKCIAVLLSECDDASFLKNSSFQDQIGEISQEIKELLNSDKYDIWISENYMQLILKDLQNQQLLNSIIQRMFNLDSELIPNIITYIFSNHQAVITVETIHGFLHFLKLKFQKKQHITQVLELLLKLIKRRIFTEYLQPQRILNLAQTFIVENVNQISHIDLNFDQSSVQSDKFKVSLSIINLSLRICKNIMVKRNEESKLCLNDKTFQSIVKLINKINEYPQDFLETIIHLSKICPLIFNMMKEKEQESVLIMYFVNGITMPKLMVEEKIRIVQAIRKIIKEADQENLQNALKDEILRISQILINHINSSFKHSSISLNSSLMSLACTLLKYQPTLTIALQNVLYNDYVPKTLKNSQQNSSFKVSSMKFLLKIIKHSGNACDDKVRSTALEAFLEFMKNENSEEMREVSIKAIAYMLTLQEVKKIPKDIKKIKENLEKIIVENQKNLKNPIIRRTQGYCFLTVNHILRLILDDTFSEDLDLTLPNMKFLLGSWFINIVTLESTTTSISTNKESDLTNNFLHIETFIYLLMSNPEFVLGKNYQNLSGVLKLLSLSLTKYCFDSEIERSLALLLSGIQSTKPMLFVMASSVLNTEEKKFIAETLEKYEEQKNTVNEQ